jgi:predicted AAA+ superfamily ATPase
MRYFNSSGLAPRQTGKSTYFHLLAAKLIEENYRVVNVNFESFRIQSLKDLKHAPPNRFYPVRFSSEAKKRA